MSPADPDVAAGSAWWRRCGIDLRVGEGSLFAVLLVLHFLLLAFQYVAKAVRQSAYIDELGAEQLPLVYLAVAVVVYPVLRIWERATRGRRLDHLLVATTLFGAACLAGFAFWFGGWPDSPWPSIVFYVWTAVAGILMVSLFWSYSAQRLDPRQARRLVGGIGAGGILGSVAGGQIARWGAGWTAGGVGGSLALAAVLLIGVAGLLVVAGRRSGSRDPRPEPESTDDFEAALGAFSIVRRSPHLRWLALGVLLSALVAQIVDLQFGWAVERSTETLEQRTAAFGNLYSVMGLAAFVFQLAVTSRLHRRLGVGLSLGVLPVTTGLGSAVFIAAALVAPAWILPIAWGLKMAENGLRYSLDQATRELLFQPVAESDRPRVKLFIDVLMQRLAKGVAAILLLSVTAGWLDVVDTAWLSLIAVVAWLVIISVMHRHYVIAFRDGLLRQVGDVDADDPVIDVHDAATLEVLIGGLGSPDSREVRHSLDLLERHDRGHLVPPLMLAHDDRQVRLAVLGLLRRSGRADAAPWIERLLGDPDPSVRAAAIRGLAAVTPDDLRRPMEERLVDSDPRVRSVAIAYLAARADPEIHSLAGNALADMLSDVDPETRRSAAQALGELPEPHFQAGLVHLLYDPSVGVARTAIEAVEKRCAAGGASPLYLPILVAHLQRRRLKHEARSALVAYGERAIPALRHFLFDPAEPIWVRRALPKTIAQIGGDLALATLVDALASRDGFVRQKVVEALGILCRDGGPCPDRDVLEAQIGVECRARIRLMLDLWSLEPTTAGRPASLLERLLGDQARGHGDRIFGLLALIHDPQEIRATRRAMEGRRAHARAHALEFLDNVLQGDVRQQVFVALDDLPRDDRLRQAKRLYGFELESAHDVLERLATQRLVGDADAPWTTASALWLIAEAELEPLYPMLRRVAERDDDPLVQETTAVLLGRLGSAA